MDISPNILRRDTIALLKEIDVEINKIPAYPDSMGRLCLASLLQGKATAYNTLVLLQAKK